MTNTCVRESEIENCLLCVCMLVELVSLDQKGKREVISSKCAHESVVLCEFSAWLVDSERGLDRERTCD